MKLCVYCTCMGQNSLTLSAEDLQAALGSSIRVVAVDRLCAAAHLAEVLPKTLKEQQVQQIVACACSASALGQKALAALREVFPKARVELADIREGCLWPAQNTLNPYVLNQAQALVQMAFARLEQLLPEKRATQPMAQDVLVVGAGPAGLAASQALANLGLSVTLVEKRPTKGGLVALLGKLFPRLEEASTLLARLEASSVTELLGYEVTALRRQEGSSALLATFQNKQESQTKAFAAVIFATGAQPVLPGKAFGWARQGVISQMELDTLLTAVEKGRKNVEELPKHAVFVQCVEARNDQKPYCSAICCPTAVKNALRLKALSPHCEICVLNRQMVMPGQSLEELYRKAMQAGVRFLHVDQLEQIRVEGENAVEAIVVTSPAGTSELRLPAERLVCSTPLLPAASTATLVQDLGLAKDSLGFLRGQEPAHPLETQEQGVFLAGSARWPVSADQAVEQGRAAAILAAGYLKSLRMPAAEIPDPGFAASIRKELCSGCGRCSEACPHKAMELGPDGLAQVSQELCAACGICAAVCPSGAAVLPQGAPSPREIFLAHRSPRPRSCS
ncbi:MAG: FAD-dependent oxidoreductase [Desulfovibrio sp.]|nr:FAD-dependent oxidoreductase [Desulfovibrio sp.]